MNLYHALPTAAEPHNKYCGPAAIAAVTGISTGKAAKMIREHSDRRMITGTSLSEMCAILAQNDLRANVTPLVKPQPTLNQWLKRAYKGELCIVEITGHWIAFCGDKFVDTHCRLPTPIENIHLKRSRVKHVLRLEPWSDEV